MRDLPPNIDRLQRLKEENLQQLGGVATAKALVGLENHRQLLNDSLARARHGYRAMAKAAGFGGEVGEAPDTDAEMGDLSVTGDQTTTYNITQPKNGMPGWLVAVLSTLAAFGLGAGASAYLMRPPENPPAQVIPDKDIGYRIELE